jgi:hypothetical protein
MKTTLALPAVFSFGILGVAAGLGVGQLSRDPRSATLTATPSDLARLEERLSQLEDQLADLARLKSAVDSLQLQKSEVRPAEAVGASESGVAADARPSSDRAEDGAPPGKLEKWLDSQGMRGEFEGLVSKVYEQARSTRRQREQDEAEERAREIKALSEGPYGKFNYRVNSLAQKLNLDARQKEYLFSLLTKYDEKRREAMSQLQPLEGDVTPERMKEHMQHTLRVHTEINQQFDSEVLLGLNSNQQDAYKDLPDGEKGTDGLADVKMISAERGVRIFTANGGPAQLEFRKAMEEAKGPPEVKSPPEKR